MLQALLNPEAGTMAAAAILFFGCAFFAFRSLAKPKTTKTTKTAKAKAAGAPQPVAAQTTGKDETFKTRMFEQASAPVVFVDSNERIFWANTAATRKLGLTKGSSFFFNQELLQDPASMTQHYVDDAFNKHCIERQTVLMNNEKMEMIVFIASLSTIAGKSFKVAEGSLPLDAAITTALEKYNYLFNSSAIPVYVDKRSETAMLDPGEEAIFKKLVYLSYQMAKDVPNTRVNFTVDTEKNRQIIQVDIRNLGKNEGHLEEKIILSPDLQGTQMDLWGELELNLSQREGRVFMYENDKYDYPVFTILVSFNKKRAVMEDAGRA